MKLFHVAEDPRCMDDRAAREPALRDELYELLITFLESRRDENWDAPDSLRDPATRMHLRALGYADYGDEEE